MLDRTELLKELRQTFNIDVSSIDDDTRLVSEGLLDSFSLVELVAFIERRCEFRFAPTEVSLDNLDSISRILRFIDEKHRGA